MVEPGQDDLAERAARAALASAGCSCDDIDLIVLATATPDNTFPSTAVSVQHRLGITKGAAFDVGEKRIAVFNKDGSFYALDDTCPHAGGPLSEGDLEGDNVVCPWHYAEFSLETGAVGCPPAAEGVQCYKVVVEGDDLKVEV